MPGSPEQNEKEFHKNILADVHKYFCNFISGLIKYGGEQLRSKLLTVFTSDQMQLSLSLVTGEEIHIIQKKICLPHTKNRIISVTIQPNANKLELFKNMEYQMGRLFLLNELHMEHKEDKTKKFSEYLKNMDTNGYESARIDFVYPLEESNDNIGSSIPERARFLAIPKELSPADFEINPMNQLISEGKLQTLAEDFLAYLLKRIRDPHNYEEKFALNLMDLHRRRVKGVLN